MAIAVARVNSSSALNSELGTFPRKARLNVTGLSTNAENTIPHGLQDAQGRAVAPARVIPVGYDPTGGTAAVAPTLDGTHGGTITNGNGWDSTNIYVVLPNGPTTGAFEVEF